MHGATASELKDWDRFASIYKGVIFVQDETPQDSQQEATEDSGLQTPQPDQPHPPVSETVESEDETLDTADSDEDDDSDDGE